MNSSVIDGLRQPEHTGENRCWPCTVVNVGILGVVAGALATVSAAFAVLAAAVGLLVIGVRGYLIPGTPRFAPALVARIPGGEALFHDAPDRRSNSLSSDQPGAEQSGAADDEETTSTETEQTDDGALAEAPAADALLERLDDAGVLRAGEETVAPTASFEERWHAEMDDLSEKDTEVLADVALEISPATDSRVVQQDGETWIALSSEADHALEETWLTRPIVIAEVGGTRAAEDFVDSESTAFAAAQTCRVFLEACPDCGTTLEYGNDASCCGGYRGPDGVPSKTLFCPSCEARVYTFE
ncbi:MAG: hypothetical protein ABEI27_03105 [Halobellus sp.]|uniref:hypothetical protein n=1 Tax=Halobellus sp. TaxID=1979212 RepID=UPI0035D4A876